MKTARLVAAAAVVIVPLLVLAEPAGASLDDPCQASGTIKGVAYNPKSRDEATIPRTGTVAWQGSVPGSGKRHIEGKVFVEIGPATINVGTWDKDSTKHANTGNYDYDFPKILAGLKVPVSGHHTEPGVACTGKIVVTIEGGKFSNPLLYGALALTVLSVVNLSLSVQAKKVA